MAKGVFEQFLGKGESPAGQVVQEVPDGTVIDGKSNEGGREFGMGSRPPAVSQNSVRNRPR